MVSGWVGRGGQYCCDWVGEVVSTVVVGRIKGV